MRRTTKIHSTLNSKARGLIARLHEWTLLCSRLVKKNETGPYDVESKDERAGDLMTITEVVSGAFNNCLSSGPRHKLASERVNYLERVLDELEVTTRERDGKLTDRLHNVLLHLNFNAREYCQAYISEVTERVRDKDTLEEKTDVLYLHMKTIAQLQCERGMRYYDLFPSVKEFIGAWLIEEIAYIERKAAKYDDEPQQSAEYVGNGMPMKVFLDTSVARLACITRALVERGIIQNSNVSDLSQLLSRFVITRRSENVSARAFRLRYYDIEDATRNSVIQSLKDLINHIKQMGQHT